MCSSDLALRKLLETILPQKSVFNDFKITQTFSAIGERFMLLNGRELTKSNSSEKLILLAINDITEIVIARNKSMADQLAREKELEEKVKTRTAELREANEQLRLENEHKEKRAAELVIANNELVFQNEEKAKRAAELLTANAELAFQNAQKEKRESELIVANQELESFTYVASHDLQEPLRKIQTFSKMISEKEANSLSEIGKDYFERMGKAARRMQILIDDLLAYSQANTKAQKFEPTDLTKLTEDVMHDFKETIEEKKVTIEINQLGVANIIPFQFRQLMQNLIGNALKFASSSRPLQISIQSNIATGSMLSQENPGLPTGKLLAEKMYHHITIADNGIGFEPKFKDKIFDLLDRKSVV